MVTQLCGRGASVNSEDYELSVEILERQLTSFSSKYKSFLQQERLVDTDLSVSLNSVDTNLVRNVSRAPISNDDASKRHLYRTWRTAMNKYRCRIKNSKTLLHKIAQDVRKERVQNWTARLYVLEERLSDILFEQKLQNGPNVVTLDPLKYDDVSSKSANVNLEETSQLEKDIVGVTSQLEGLLRNQKTIGVRHAEDSVLPVSSGAYEATTSGEYEAEELPKDKNKEAVEKLHYGGTRDRDANEQEASGAEKLKIDHIGENLEGSEAKIVQQILKDLSKFGSLVDLSKSNSIKPHQQPLLENLLNTPSGKNVAKRQVVPLTGSVAERRKLFDSEGSSANCRRSGIDVNHSGIKDDLVNLAAELKNSALTYKDILTKDNKQLQKNVQAQQKSLDNTEYSQMSAKKLIRGKSLGFLWEMIMLVVAVLLFFCILWFIFFTSPIA